MLAEVWAMVQRTAVLIIRAEVPGNWYPCTGEAAFHE
jgi:hypothetical protein